MRRLLAFAAALALAAPAAAGTRAVYSAPDQPGKQLQIEVGDNGDLRIGEASSSDYGLLIGNQFYMVSMKDDQLHVARLADIAAAFDQVLPPIFKQIFSAAGSAEASKLVIEKQGEKSVNGRTGTVYAVKGLDETDPTKPTMFLVSSDPALAPVGRAMDRFIEASLVLASPLIGNATAGMIADVRRISALGTPLDSDRFKLESADTAATIDPKRLALPAKPETVEAIVASLKMQLPPK